MGNEQGKEKIKISIICGKMNFTFNPITGEPSNTDCTSSTAVAGRGNGGSEIRTEGAKKNEGKIWDGVRFLHVVFWQSIIIQAEMLILIEKDKNSSSPRIVETSNVPTNPKNLFIIGNVNGSIGTGYFIPIHLLTWRNFIPEDDY